MTERTRCPIIHIPESDVPAYWEAGWNYIGPAPADGFAIMQWESPKRPLLPVADQEMSYLRGAVGALEGRAQ